MKYQSIKVLSFAILSALALPVAAQGIVLNNEDLRTDLNWLNQQGVIQISTSTWPLSGEEIQRALSTAKIENNAQQKVVNSVMANLEAGIPAKYKMNLTAEDKTKYQNMLRDGRMDMTKRGIYDPAMMSVLKKARCSVDKANFECSLGGE